MKSDLVSKSLTIFEKGPPTQPSLILLMSNYCHPPYNCTTKVVFIGFTHWSVEIPLYYLCCVCCVVFLSRICHLRVEICLSDRFVETGCSALRKPVRLYRQPYSTIVDSRITNPNPDCSVCNDHVTVPLCDRILLVVPLYLGND
jgi:hypothetical protein